MLFLLCSFLFLYLSSAYKRCNNLNDASCNEVSETLFGTKLSDTSKMSLLMRQIFKGRVECKLNGECPINSTSVYGPIKCKNGKVTHKDVSWDCNGIDLLAHISLLDLGSDPLADGNDMWGWTENFKNSNKKRYYALTGQSDGASIIDVTEATRPEVLCFIPTAADRFLLWRDLKVINDILYIAADGHYHGLQWVNLQTTVELCRNNKNSTSPYVLKKDEIGWTEDIYQPYTFPNTTITVQLSNTHNLVANEETNTLIIVGSWSYDAGPLYLDVSGVKDIHTKPVYKGSFMGSGRCHDAECWIYSGPDKRFTGKEVCAAYNERAVYLLDISDRQNTKIITEFTYKDAGYVHQGWKTDDQKYLIFNDEHDEFGEDKEAEIIVKNQTTYILNIESLTNPILRKYTSKLRVVDHNLYIKGDFVYQANYAEGLRILKFDPDNFESGANVLQEIGFFKTYYEEPKNWRGAWSNYIYWGEEFPYVGVQDIETGFYLLDASDLIKKNSKKKY